LEVANINSQRWYLQLSSYGLIYDTTPHTTFLCLAISHSILVKKSKLISPNGKKTRPDVFFIDMTLKVDTYLYNKNDDRYHFYANINLTVTKQANITTITSTEMWQLLQHQHNNNIK
jgi:hypothetical protein